LEIEPRRATLTYYAGLDVSLEQTSVCVVDDGATVVLERRVATDPAAIVARLAGLPAPPTGCCWRPAV
jgi:transposase